MNSNSRWMAQVDAKNISTYILYPSFVFLDKLHLLSFLMLRVVLLVLCILHARHFSLHVCVCTDTNILSYLIWLLLLLLVLRPLCIIIELVSRKLITYLIWMPIWLYYIHLLFVYFTYTGKVPLLAPFCLYYFFTYQKE